MSLSTAARNGWHQQDFIAFLHGALFAAKKTNIFIVQIDIQKQETDIAKIKKEQTEISRKNDKQAQNQRLTSLEEETKFYFKENKRIEKEIDEMLKKNQKKESDTHTIKLAINNLFSKVDSKSKKGKEFDMEIDNNGLCLKLDAINEKIVDLIKIHKELES